MPGFKANQATTLQDLLDIRNIEQLKYRYMRAIDTLDWALMESCFAPAARVWYAGGRYSQQGRENILAFFKNALHANHFSTHIALHPEISITGPDTAKAIWRFQDLVYNSDADYSKTYSHSLKQGEKAEGAGIYHDEYVRLENEWRIASTGFIRIYEYLTTPRYAVTRDFGQTGDTLLRAQPERGLHARLPSQEG